MLATVREIALGLPGAAEKVSHGRPAFYTTKVFAYYGGAVKVAGSWTQRDQAIVVQPERSERDALLEQPRVFVPGYLGPYGWIGLDLSDTDDCWEEAAELVDASYRNTASARLVAALDAA